ncbi:MAG: phosphomannomutase/phosphoglucomutase [Atopostipes suicloacalis]|nr:phosphomannomutase/phosphoglucomutase [Atopostipes suicloacalis]MDN6730764.1 phosphomannomutase/phosphoglucomutase [Atopostipes suicloacalis]
MKKEDFMQLANGSDIRGIAMEGLDYAVNLNKETVSSIGEGFLKWLDKNISPKEKQYKIAIGYDGRLTGEEIKKTLTGIFVEAGVNVIDVGIATTPSLFMATQYRDYNADAGIEITASHLPKEYNGLKFFTSNAGLDSKAIHFILENAYRTSGSYSLEEKPGEVVKRDLIKDYSADLREKIIAGLPKEKRTKTPLKGRHILVDAGNGSAGFFVKEILEKLGADTKGSQFLESDGHFPNHIPNPDDKDAMESLRKAVLDYQADIGIIFDTDADRAAVMDGNGRSINRNNLIALAAAIALEDAEEGMIVTNSPVSNHAINFIKDKGGQVEPYISGYKNVIDRSIALNQEGIYSPLAIETSGHAAFKENYFLDDGSYLIAKILIADAKAQLKGKSVFDLIDGLKEPVETEEIRYVIDRENYSEYGLAIIDDLEEYGRKNTDFDFVPENKEGVRFNVSGQYGEGWFLLRMSLHEPKLVLQMENDEEGSIEILKQTLLPFFEKYENIN